MASNWSVNLSSHVLYYYRLHYWYSTILQNTELSGKYLENIGKTCWVLASEI